jgi:uncharacterized protein YggE
MRPTSRVPLAVLGGAALIAAVLALRPGGPGSTVATPELAHAATASTTPGPLVPFLRFSGTGTITVKPDTAVINVGANGDGKTSSSALQKAAKRLAAVQDRLLSLGVARDDITTTGNWTYQDWQARSWHAELSVTVKVRKIDDAGKLLSEASDAGASNVSGPSFSVADTHAAYGEALRKAIEDARSKAEAAAAQMGVKVTGVVSVDDQSQGSIMPYGVMMDSSKAMAAPSAGGAASTPVPVPVNPGTQDISATVLVVFSYA